MAKKIVLFSTFLTPFRSGAEACVEEVSARLQKEYDITIITARLRKDLPKQDKLLSGVPVIRVGIGRSIDKWLFPILAPLTARKLKPDILHAVLESYAGLALVVSRIVYPKAKRLLTCQSTNTTLLLGTIHKSGHAVTAISSVLVERAKKFGRDAELIPNGIELSVIQAACKTTPKVPRRILFVGRLEPMKGVDTLLEALSLLPQKDWTLHIVGDGSQMKPLKQLAKKLDIADNARFLGRLTGPLLWSEYAEAEIFCGLSRSEALGNVFLEAQAAGCAVVTTNVGGIPDIVQDGNTGMLVPPNDAKSATEAIEKLSKDKEARQRLGEAGKANASGYDWEAIAKKYDETYQRVLK